MALMVHVSQKEGITTAESVILCPTMKKKDTCKNSEDDGFNLLFAKHHYFLHNEIL